MTADIITGSVGTPEECRKAIRREKLAARKALTPAVRREADDRITDRLRHLFATEDFTTIAGFITDGTEPDLTPVLAEALAAGKTLCLPRFKDAEHYDMVHVRSLTLTGEKFGIPEPGPEDPVIADDLLKNAVWLVPGVAFDTWCRRIGRGKGVYDRLLSSRQPKLAIGIFYECQKCSSIPSKQHDQPLDLIVTEDRCYMASSR